MGRGEWVWSWTWVGGTGQPLNACLAPFPSPQGLQGFQGDRGLAGEKGEEVRWLSLAQHLVLWAHLGASPSLSPLNAKQ